MLDAGFNENSVDNYGGGLYVYAGNNVDISNVEFIGNSSYQYGGGIYLKDADSLAMTDIKILDNDGSEGGGAYISCGGTLTNLEICGNSAGRGGGLYNFGGDLYLYNAVFYNNSATYEGAGVYGYYAVAQMVNCTFGRNVGLNCIYNYEYATLHLVNSIIWDNEVPIFYSIENAEGAEVVISYSLVEDCYGKQGGGGQTVWNEAYGLDGGNNLNEDPLYVDPLNGNLRLLSGSPAIDAGDDAVAGLPSTDLLGNPRITGETIDMGAYEGAVIPMEVTVTTDPPGLEVIVAGSSYTSPYTMASVSGMEIMIGVASPQTVNEITYSFVEWSDGGDTTHVVTLPDTNVTYTAIFTDQVTGDEVEPVPLLNALHQNHPNPFNPVTTIGFSLGGRGHVSLAVYDVAGRLVKVLADRVMDAGPHEAAWDGRDARGKAVASGVYFYRLETGVYRDTRKMVLLR